MNANELRNKYLEDLKTRLAELVSEQQQIESTLAGSGGIERRATSDDRPPRKRAAWTPARRKEQSRRMKRLHKEGKFR